MFKTTYLTACIAIVSSLVVNGIFYYVTKPPIIATVDVLSVTSQFIKEEARKNRSNHEKEVAIRAFSHHLETALKELSKSKSLVLLPREAVIKGSPDYTTTLMSIMSLEPSL